jgi:hypothetical protein
MKKQFNDVSARRKQVLLRSAMAVSCLFAFNSYADAQTWGVSTVTSNVGRTNINVSYGSAATGYPEYAVFDTGSSYFRLVPDTSSAWASSLILNPAYWSNGSLNQGGSLTLQSHEIVNGNLVLTFTGYIGSLGTASKVTIHPPATAVTGTNAVNSIEADVDVTVSGSVTLDQRPGEAFKIVQVSSMHDSDAIWDNQYIQSASGKKFEYPNVTGWVIADNVVSTKNFLLQGGISSWQQQSSNGLAAPSIAVTLDKARPVLSYQTADNNPNDDNILVWTASDNNGETVQSHWTYSVKAQRSYTVTP